MTVVPAHLGPLHPVEQALVLLLAFGPLLLLAVTIWVSRRRHLQDDEGSSTYVGRHERDAAHGPTPGRQ